MLSQDLVLRLIALIYDAALAPAGWEGFLNELARAIDGHSVSLSFIAPRPPHTVIYQATSRMDPGFSREYAEHYAAYDPWVVEAGRRGLLRAGIVGLGEEIVSPADLRKTPFFNDLGRRFDFIGGVAAIAGNTDGWAAISSSQRKYGQFGALELNLFRELLPHVGRGVTLRRRLSGLDVQHDAAGDLVDCLPTPVILVDCGAKPLLVNRAARELLSRRDGLSCTRDGLVADSPSETRCLWRLVAEAAASGAGNGFNAGGLIKISRRSLKQPFAVLVAPLRPGRQGRSPFRNSAAVVFIQDLDARPKGVFRILRTMYGLTPAESRVAALLAGGAGTVTVADTLGVAPSTIRTHVKRIFAKTGVRTQAQLVRLLSGLAALDLE